MILENKNFIININENNNISLIKLANSVSNMNWAKGNKEWGSYIVPKGIEVSVHRKFLENGNFKETYQFKNISQFPIGFKNTDIGIYITFNDNYENANVCINERCHTHIFCGGEASYIMALQMGGKPPHIGLKFTKGNISSYSVERNLDEMSNDRGDFIIHPNFEIMQPNETFEVEWEIFLFENKKDFNNKILCTKYFPVIKSKQYTYFLEDTINFEIIVNGIVEENEININYQNKQIEFDVIYDENSTKIKCNYIANNLGENKINVLIKNRKTYILFYICKPLLQIVEERCKFITQKQQYKNINSVLNGAYLIYDNEEEKMYYSHLDDHNGGRERICMAILIAKYLQKNNNKEIMDSLKEYINYFYRELYDENTGVVYNDVKRNLDWNRLYNYPWVSVFQLELYNLFNDIKYLKDCFNTMKSYYKQGGHSFYGIGIPAIEIIESLKKENLTKELDSFLEDFLKHCNNILENSLNYPPFEVKYEQSIVAPAVSCLLQAYNITKDEKFLKEAEKQILVLDLFNGQQPNYYQYEVSIRHWDGKWFGKYANYGDTYPHYWSVLTGICFLQYANTIKNNIFIEKANASLRGCLNLFKLDGSASCAMVYPKTINGKTGHYYDPWANDQDWALYFALKNENIMKNQTLIERKR